MFNIPNDTMTRFAIDDVEADVARGINPRLGVEIADRMVVWHIRGGDGLVWARGWAMESAMHRDRALTGPELHALFEARS